MPNEGDKAPGFDLLNQDGEPVKLSDFAGRTVVLYFYPKADTPGCTIQACGIRDRTGEYEQAGAVVLGVSPDEPKALRKFADKYDLPFTLRLGPRALAGRGLRRLGREEQVRPHLLGQRAHDLRHRRRGQDRARSSRRSRRRITTT